jgi:hypothetical protein
MLSRRPAGDGGEIVGDADRDRGHGVGLPVGARDERRST